MKLSSYKLTVQIAFFSCCLIIISSCSQKKNTFTSRTYHNLTAHYNGLYWANVSLDEGVSNLERAHKDDYSKLLPVFRYADDKASKANYPQFDKAIEKNSKVIQYHSMLIKGKEYCRWIDENYMTMGKAHFYKRDYYASVEVFEYVVKMYSDNPVKYDAFLWLVRAYNQMNSVIKTGPILDLLKHDKGLPKKFLDDYYAVQSDYFLRTEQYKKAVDALSKTILLTKKKALRGRYFYILAQLHEQEGDLQKASQYYEASAKLHPSYEMEFNARLSRARTFQVQSGTDTKALKKELNKMLKDEKNKEYLDQIYYALGDISMKENDVSSALGYFKLSAQKSVSNTKQKSESYLRIADTYFEQKDYKLAQAYYDSTMVFLPKDFKNYDQIKNKKESLTLMVKNMGIISKEDSLLKVSQMDTAKISKLIDEIIAKLIEEEEKKKIEEEIKAQNPSSINDENKPWQNSSSAGGWYFYNMTSLSLGFAEFNKKWGNRPLEDNWRRSNKETIMAEQLIDTSSSDTSGGPGKIADNKTHAYYLRDIPFSDEQKAKSNLKIMEAYYALGSVYKELLQDNAKASETFEEMLRRYPDNKYVLNLYYQLYRIYLGMENQGRANYYKDKILNEYPDSEYAKIIKNPDYQKALKASKNEIEKYYSETYSTYNSGRYGEVIAMVSKADSFYSGSELMPRFALLRAFSIGKTRDLNDFENALQGVIAKYPKDDAKIKAQEIVDQIKKKKSAPVDSSALKDTVVLKPIYFFKDSTEHYCIIILKGKKININDFKTRVSNFNSEYFRLSDLSISSVMIDMESQIVYVKSFPVASKAKDYYDLMNQDSKVFKDILVSEYKVFPISSENFTILYKEKKFDEYQHFFTDNYLKKKEE